MADLPTPDDTIDIGLRDRLATLAPPAPLDLATLDRLEAEVRAGAARARRRQHRRCRPGRRYRGCGRRPVGGRAGLAGFQRPTRHRRATLDARGPSWPRPAAHGQRRRPAGGPLAHHRPGAAHVLGHRPARSDRDQPVDRRRRSLRLRVVAHPRHRLGRHVRHRPSVVARRCRVDRDGSGAQRPRGDQSRRAAAGKRTCARTRALRGDGGGPPNGSIRAWYGPPPTGTADLAGVTALSWSHDCMLVAVSHQLLHHHRGGLG